MRVAHGARSASIAGSLDRGFCALGTYGAYSPTFRSSGVCVNTYVSRTRNSAGRHRPSVLPNLLLGRQLHDRDETRLGVLTSCQNLPFRARASHVANRQMILAPQVKSSAGQRRKSSSASKRRKKRPRPQEENEVANTSNGEHATASGQVITAQANFVRVLVRPAEMSEMQKAERVQQLRASIARAEKAGVAPTVPLVEDTDLDSPLEILCTVRALLKKIKQKVLVGDNVNLIGIDWVDQRGLVEDVQPRASEYGDPAIANVSNVLLVFAMTQPPLEVYQVSRFLVAAEAAGLPLTVALNKADLVEESEREAWRKRLGQWGYSPTFISVATGEGLDELNDRLVGQITVVAGPSGVGKSSLINRLRLGALGQEHEILATRDLRWESDEGSDEEADAEDALAGGDDGASNGWGKFDVEKDIMGDGGGGAGKNKNRQRASQLGIQSVGSVSVYGRGRHTTRHVTLLQMPFGGLLADTPGFSQPALEGVTCEQLPWLFPEIRQRLEAAQGGDLPDDLADRLDRWAALEDALPEDDRPEDGAESPGTQEDSISTNQAAGARSDSAGRAEADRAGDPARMDGEETGTETRHRGAHETGDDDADSGGEGGWDTDDDDEGGRKPMDAAEGMRMIQRMLEEQMGAAAGTGGGREGGGGEQDTKQQARQQVLEYLREMEEKVTRARSNPAATDSDDEGQTPEYKLMKLMGMLGGTGSEEEVAARAEAQMLREIEERAKEAGWWRRERAGWSLEELEAAAEAAVAHPQGAKEGRRRANKAQHRTLRSGCQFRNCTHRREPLCAVRGGWERYELYVRLYAEVEAREAAAQEQGGKRDEPRTRSKSGKRGGKARLEAKLEPKKHRRQNRNQGKVRMLDRLYEETDDEDDFV